MMKSVNSYPRRLCFFRHFPRFGRGSGSLFPFENHSFVTSFTFCLTHPALFVMFLTLTHQTKGKGSHKTMIFEREQRTACPSQIVENGEKNKDGGGMN